jgi:protein-tyrosine phosphatase
MFNIFAEPENHPVLVHCTAGKDRTGVTTAFLLSILGVERAIIEADYVLTNRDVPRQVTFVENSIGLPEGMTHESLTQAAGVPEDAIGDFLDGMDENYGGALSYLRSIGISDEIQATIRDKYLEE